MDKKGSYIKYILIKILYVIIIPIILYDIILIAQTIIKPDETPSIFGIKTFNIISSSMKPTIGINDIVIVKKVDGSKLKENDIITFNINGDVITHRIIKIENVNNEQIYITKGDSNEVSDSDKITYDNIEGKYLFKIPKIGKVLNFLKNKIVFTAILVILIISFIYEKKKLQIKVRRKEKRRKWDRAKNNDNT